MNTRYILFAVVVVFSNNGCLGTLRECPGNERSCATGDCIPIHLFCDGSFDCPDRSDEDNCTTENLSMIKQADTFKAIVHRMNKAFQNLLEEIMAGFYMVSSQVGYSKLDCEDGFRCHNGHQCVDTSLVCDGNHDCDDGSDESTCDILLRPASLEIASHSFPGECTEEKNYECSDGYCISQYAVCDGRPDCPDKSDEINCPAGCESSKDMFLCKGDELMQASICILNELVCNGVSDCPSGSDEAKSLCKSPSDSLKRHASSFEEDKDENESGMFHHNKIHPKFDHMKEMEHNEGHKFDKMEHMEHGEDKMMHKSMHPESVQTMESYKHPRMMHVDEDVQLIEEVEEEEEKLMQEKEEEEEDPMMMNHHGKKPAFERTMMMHQPESEPELAQEYPELARNMMKHHEPEPMSPEDSIEFENLEEQNLNIQKMSLSEVENVEIVEDEVNEVVDELEALQKELVRVPVIHKSNLEIEEAIQQEMTHDADEIEELIVEDIESIMFQTLEAPADELFEDEEPTEPTTTTSTTTTTTTATEIETQPITTVTTEEIQVATTTTTPCGFNMFSCGGSSCIPNEWVCDKFDDCPTNESGVAFDETEAACAEKNKS